MLALYVVCSLDGDSGLAIAIRDICSIVIYDMIRVVPDGGTNTERINIEDILFVQLEKLNHHVCC